MYVAASLNVCSGLASAASKHAYGHPRSARNQPENSKYVGAPAGSGKSHPFLQYAQKENLPNAAEKEQTVFLIFNIKDQSFKTTYIFRKKLC